MGLTTITVIITAVLMNMVMVDSNCECAVVCVKSMTVFSHGNLCVITSMVKW